MRPLATLVLTLMLALGAGSTTVGCSAHTTTTRTVERTDGDGPVRRVSTTTTEETKEEEHDDDGPHFGILSGTVKAIGWVLALPFRAIGGLISIIF
jgi:hypothetical protein